MVKFYDGLEYQSSASFQQMTDQSHKLELLLYSWRGLDTPKNDIAYSTDQSEGNEGEPSSLVGLCLKSISKALVSDSWQKLFTSLDVFVCNSYIEQVKQLLDRLLCIQLYVVVSNSFIPEWCAGSLVDFSPPDSYQCRSTQPLRHRRTPTYPTC
jgi:hypothetical protein